MNKLKEKLEQAISGSTALQKIREHVIFTVTGEGLRVELLEGEHSTFFESGSPVPTDFGKELLGKLAQEIGKLPNASPWKGTRIRSRSPRRRLLELGTIERPRECRPTMDAAKRHAPGSGHPDPWLCRSESQRPGPSADASNRRVTLIIQYQSANSLADAPPSAEGVRQKRQYNKASE